MKIYKDKITGDELLSDTYDFKLVDDIVYEVEGKYKTETSSDANIDIGANASAEEPAEEASESASQTGINVILEYRLVAAPPFDKKSYLAYIKDYVKKIKNKLAEDEPDRVDTFIKAAEPFVKKVAGNIKANKDFYQFFTGESMNPDGMVVLVEHRDVDGVEVPTLILFKDGLDEEKV